MKKRVMQVTVIIFLFLFSLSLILSIQNSNNRIYSDKCIEGQMQDIDTCIIESHESGHSASNVVLDPINVGPIGSLPHFTADHFNEGARLERIPDAGAFPTKTAINGRWSQIWNSNQPEKKDVIMIPSGVSVIYDVQSDQTFKTLAVKGNLEFDPNINNRLTVGTIIVYPGGTLKIKPRDKNIIHEIVFSGNINTTEDPGQFTIGLYTLGGTIDIQGTKVTDPFIPLLEAKPGQSNIKLSRAPVEWRVGDEIVLATGSIMQKMKIQSIDGQIIRTDKILETNHTGVVAHLTRNVIFKNSPDSAPGHILFSGSTKATLAYSFLNQLGRTTTANLSDVKRDRNGNALAVGKNQRGRYSVHAHHPEWTFNFEGNIAYGGPRWCIVSHNAYGFISKNIAIGCDGAGIVTEFGTEIGRIENNLVIGTGGGSSFNDDSRWFNDNIVPKSFDFAHGGHGYWFGSPGTIVKNNVAQGNFLIGAFTLYQVYDRHLAAPSITQMNKFERFATTIDAPPELKGKTALLGTMPYEEFSGQTNYATIASPGAAIRIEWQRGPYENVIKDFTSYHGGILINLATAITFANANLHENGKGLFVWPSSYYVAPAMIDLKVINSRITGFDRSFGDPLWILHLANTTIETVNEDISGYSGKNVLIPGEFQDSPYIYKENFTFTKKNLIDANKAPLVSINNPKFNNKIIFYQPLTIQVGATDPDGTISKVEFFIDDKYYGEDKTSPYEISIKNLYPGRHDIKVKATDNKGLSTTLTYKKMVEIVTGFNKTFYRGIDLGSNNPITIDGNAWEGQNAQNIEAINLFKKSIKETTLTYDLPSVSDPSKRKMLSTFLYDSSPRFIFNNVPKGEYEVYLYVMQKDDLGKFYGRSTHIISVENETRFPIWFAPEYAREWVKVGPFRAYSEDNNLDVTSWANNFFLFVSGIEVWKVTQENPPQQAPYISLKNPKNDDYFEIPAQIKFEALAFDDESISKVEFFINSQKISEDTSEPYEFTWNASIEGEHLVNAKATDNKGLSESTMPVKIFLQKRNLSKFNKEEYNQGILLRYKEDNKKAIYLTNFTINDSRLEGISIMKSTASENQGYIIIKNLILNENETKEIYLDKINQDSTGACFRDDEIALTKDDILKNCTYLPCPSNSTEFSCVQENEYYIIKGLKNSAAIESKVSNCANNCQIENTQSHQTNNPSLNPFVPPSYTQPGSHAPSYQESLSNNQSQGEVENKEKLFNISDEKKTLLILLITALFMILAIMAYFLIDKLSS